MDNNEGNFYRGSGANNLRKAEENAAAAKINDSDGSTADIQQAETGAERGYYRATKEKLDLRKGKLRGAFKKKGVTGLLIGLIFGAMVAVGGSQAMQPFSLIAQFKETFNSMQTSTSQRFIARFQLKSPSGIITKMKAAFGDKGMAPSDTQKESWSKQGIDYDDSTGTRTLQVADADGSTKTITSANFDTEIDTDTNFNNKYTAGSKGWRGAISNWFNKTTDKFLSSNKLTRNLFKDYLSSKADADGDEEAALVNSIAKRGNGDISTKNDSIAVGEEEESESNKTLKEVGDDDSGAGTIKREEMQSEEGIKGTIKKFKDRFLGVKNLDGDETPTAAVSENANSQGISGADVAQGIAKAADMGCKVTNVINKISLLAVANEMLQIINLTTGVFEGIDKAKAGSGNESPINAIGNVLNQSRTNNISELVGVTGEGENAQAEMKETTSTKSPMESAGIVSLYSGQPVNTSDPSVKSFNVTSSISTILKGLGFSMASYKTCLNIRAAVAGSGLVLAILAPAKIGLQMVGKGAVGLAVAAVTAVMVPMVAKLLTRDLITNIGGEDLGNALTSGANIYMGNAHRTNGGSLATKDKYIEYAAAHEQTIAENARYERTTKSPFDASSNYTFMGTLARQMMSFAGSNSLLSTLASAGTVLSSSIMNLTPAASAYDIEKTLTASSSEEYAEQCPYLAAVGAVGDAFCNPYVITDTTTLDEDPGEVAEKISDNLEEDGSIKKDSDLAKYITFCNRRNSPFGIPDQEIVGKLTTTGSMALDTAIGMVPGLNDAADLWNVGKELSYTGYITGQSCVAGNEPSEEEKEANAKLKSDYGEEDTGIATPEWDTAKYYQRFIEDQSLLETTGVLDKSVVTAFLEEYDEENPVDNSYEGMLARYSGLSKEETIAYLDYIDYYEYVAKYDASERYAFGQDKIEGKDQLIIEENELENTPQYILMDAIAYADVRNRQTIA